MRVVAIDPAGDFTKGKGVTGFIMVEVKEDHYDIIDMGSIKADDFENRLDYWEEHIKLVNPSIDVVIIEDYRLYNHAGMSAAQQTGSYLETPRLLGLLEFWAKHNNIEIVWQMARDTQAYKEDVLVARKILRKQGNRYYLGGKPTNDHIRSALKHLHRWLGGRK